MLNIAQMGPCLICVRSTLFVLPKHQSAYTTLSYFYSLMALLQTIL